MQLMISNCLVIVGIVCIKKFLNIEERRDTDMAGYRIADLELIHVKTIACSNAATTNLNTNSWLCQTSYIACAIASSPEILCTNLCLEHKVFCEPYGWTDTKSDAITIQIILSLTILAPCVVEIKEEILTDIKSEELMITIDDTIVYVNGIYVFMIVETRRV